MKTDVITIHSDLSGREEALEAAERFAAYNGITGKDAMHLRLLTEETVSMINGILDNFTGEIWLESKKTKNGLLCLICLSANKQANRAQEEHILSVSTSGRNESSKGIAGKIREVIRHSLQASSTEDEAFLQSISDACMSIGMCSGTSTLPMPGVDYWSLQFYRQKIAEQKVEKAEEWDELEKSIISNLADEVKVWLRSDSTEVVIEKCFNT